MLNDDQRLDHLKRFYSILRRLETTLGGPRRLSGCNPDMDWPLRGVYFFMEAGEGRSDSGKGLRVVRVGAVRKKRLWKRLYAHSIGRSNFASLIALTLARRYGESSREDATEKILDMPFLWLAVDEHVPRRYTNRYYIERNAIALLSNYYRIQLDRPSRSWLGHFSGDNKVARSGLWNSRLVGHRHYDPRFLGILDACVDEI